MLSSLSILFVGFLLGMRHATEADHVVAVTAIVSHQRSLVRASATGVLWGLGHSAILFALGGAIILLQLAIPPRVALALEFSVALMLIVLGALNIAGLRRAVVPSAVRPVAVGVVHGLAGTGAATLLVMAAIAGARWQLAYLLVFGLGTVAGMALVTAAIALPSLYAASRLAYAQRTVRVGAGVLSLAFGLYLAHRVGIVDGLFSAPAHGAAAMPE